ncbi:MAG: carboxylating nicotinate-nucleotide diphosphorylase [Dehalococcoidia bacterium]|nr:carboxylating nicotinate-nucleotide diphosphorylase [Dehalococcoidia bacterium]
MIIDAWISNLIDCAFAEDFVSDDITTMALVSSDQVGGASIVIKEKGVLAGVDLVREVFHRIDPDIVIDVFLQDGSRVKMGDVVARVEGRVASILRVERVVLNFLQRLSGIASDTSKYVEAVAGLPVRIMDTRKTTPGLRTLEKYAVKVGGGKNHRVHLGDGILIKDNHLVSLLNEGLNLSQVITRAKRRGSPKLRVEVEVKSVAEAVEAVGAGAEVVMLDNMSLDDMRVAVKSIGGRALVEASGGITLSNVRDVAQTGVNFISVGAITHSYHSLDISLDLDRCGGK